MIQFPMGQPETIKAVEDRLSSMGYTYDNGMVNVWMSDEKIVGDDLTNLDGSANEAGNIYRGGTVQEQKY